MHVIALESSKLNTWYECPYDHETLNSHGIYIPGMRMLANLKCPACSSEFFADLPAGHGLIYPCLLDKSSGKVFASPKTWFADWLEKSYKARTTNTVGLSVERFRPVKRSLLLNCLDGLYGHSLLKLLNAQYHLTHHSDRDLIVIVPDKLRWLVPDGVAAVFSVHQSDDDSGWNDWLAARFSQELCLDECSLSLALPHPGGRDIDITKFSRIAPFDMSKWTDNLDVPKITFVCRDDRLWRKEPLPVRRRDKLRGKIVVNSDQNENITRLANNLRDRIPAMVFSTVGLSEPGGLPDWINDRRSTTITDKVENDWCTTYSQSHIVIGVHGSNMLLPSAHAGATLVLMPSQRWGNVAQDVICGNMEAQEALARIHFLPLETEPDALCEIICTLLTETPLLSLSFGTHVKERRELSSDPKSARLETQRLMKNITEKLQQNRVAQS